MDLCFLKKCTVYLSIFAYSSSFAETFQGSIYVVIRDDFKANKSTYEYFLKHHNKIYSLKLENNVSKKIKLVTGDEVTIDGDVIHQSAIKINNISVSRHSSMNKNRVGQRKTLTLMINFTDKKATDFASTVSLDQQLYTDPMSVNSNYVTSSSNQLSFLRSVDSTGTPGISSVTLNYAAASSCDYIKWGSDAIAAATQAGYKIHAYNHWLYILPGNIHCPFGGIAYLGCSGTCEAWVRGGGNISGVMAHELGHNLGLEHAATDTSEYGDLSDFMGPGVNRQLNAPHRDLMRWYQSYPEKLATVTQSSQYRLHSLDQIQIQDGLQILKIKAKNSAATYYISYRTDTQPFGMGALYSGYVYVHYTLSGDGHSYLVTALAPTQSFVDAVNGITITAVSVSDGAVMLDVTLS
jgi:hypothetical protein